MILAVCLNNSRQTCEMKFSHEQESNRADSPSSLSVRNICPAKLCRTSGDFSSLSFGPIRTVSVTGTTSFISANWAGYGYNGSANSITKAQGSWIQPSVTCNSSLNDSQFAVFWVGIDGLNSGTVEQVGTLAYCPIGSTTPQYYAWYEFYPAQAVISVTSVTVSPGNVFQGVVKFNATTSKFSVTLKDITTGTHFTKSNPSGFTGSRSSAECIAEDPGGSTSHSGLYYLAKFGTVKFGQDYTAVKNTCTATVNGKTKAIGAFGKLSDELTMVNFLNPTVIMAKPSALTTDKKSFTITWKSAGP